MILRDRRQAGRLLAKKLLRYSGRKDCIVVALPKGGVPVGFELAQALDLDFDVCVVRKLRVPFQPELAMGAIASGGVVVLNQEVLSSLRISRREIDRQAATEWGEVDRRERMYRAVHPVISILGKTVILVDDGIATGMTTEAAIQAVRKRGAARVIVATGVASPATIARLENIADEVVCLMTPEPMEAVSESYAQFEQTTDEEVCGLLTTGVGAPAASRG